MAKKKTKTTTTKKARSASRRTTKVTKAKPKKTVVNKAAKKVVSKKVEAKKPQATKPAPPPKGAPSGPKPIEFDSPLVKKYQEHKGDTGSTGVQIALISDRIQELVKHLKKHAKDFDSKRGLLILVGKRRRLLNYLKKTNQKTYEAMITDLKLRK